MTGAPDGPTPADAAAVGTGLLGGTLVTGGGTALVEAGVLAAEATNPVGWVLLGGTALYFGLRALQHANQKADEQGAESPPAAVCNCPVSTPADPNQGGPDDEDTDDGTDPDKRNKYLGRTPSKSSRTGREVIDRMRAEGRVRGTGSNIEFQSKTDGQWRPLQEADMAHKQDAVTYWNTEGKFLGPKSPEVRQWMLNSNNYELEYYGYNRSAGARLGETYDSPP